MKLGIVFLLIIVYIPCTYLAYRWPVKRRTVL